MIGLTDAEWHHDPEQAAAVMANDRRIIETGRAEDIRGDRGRDGPRHARVPVGQGAAAAWRTASDLGVVAVSSDITQIKDTEAALRRLTADLEARVSEEVAARESGPARAARRRAGAGPRPARRRHRA